MKIGGFLELPQRRQQGTFSLSMDFSRAHTLLPLGMVLEFQSPLTERYGFKDMSSHIGTDNRCNHHTKTSNAVNLYTLVEQKPVSLAASTDDNSLLVYSIPLTAVR